MESGENVYLRGFGSFVVKKELKKQEEIFQKTQRLIIPEHFVPTFKTS
jgi:DNA-binding protein HU-beta